MYHILPILCHLPIRSGIKPVVILCKTFIIRTEKKSNKGGMLSREELGREHNLSAKEEEELHGSASSLQLQQTWEKKSKPG